MNIDDRLIDCAAVVHFNGNMKPWLKLAIGRYKPLWERGRTVEDSILADGVSFPLLQAVE
ncbi:unnamed protein product [Dovyalis caffra]|uniref:Hexosyltransferase n=1 Tax=Dovyalis caffra TaxID=77055 RepID=A0AAV1QQF3_9ROSI|nr:unnamed protein product [Dovyalis caffra]